MLNIKNLLVKTQKPINEDLLNNLLTKYLAIPLNDFNNDNIEFKNLLYKEINIINKNGEFNKKDISAFFKTLNEDFIAAGKPYDSSKHNGIANPTALMPGWTLIKSWDLLGTEKIATKDLNHRFYFSIPKNKIYEFAQILYNEFKKAQIPFYFKIESNEAYERQDNLVLYTSTLYLEKTLDVINKVKEENQELMHTSKEPSIIMGNIDNEIGYAMEGKNSSASYTDTICEIFHMALIMTLNNYVTNATEETKNYYQNLKTTYQKNGQKIETSKAKNRILVEILLNINPNFKKDLLENFKKAALTYGINPHDICSNLEIIKEISKYYDLINLPNGKTLSKEEYLQEFNIADLIPEDSIITLKNGKVMGRDEFITGILERANNFNNFNDLINYYGVKVTNSKQR